MRGVGIDYGMRNIGVAVSDELGKLAFPSEVFQNDNNAMQKILQVIDSKEATFVVVGESKQYSGEDNKLMGDILKFVSDLKDERNIPVYMHTEVLTTKEAERLQGVKNPKKDASAAALILQSYIDVQKNKN